MRRGNVVRRPILPDARFGNIHVTQFIGRLMYDGKRTLAEHIMYQAMEIIDERAKAATDDRLKRAPVEIFELALRNATPTVEVKPRRVGGATYQVPVDIRRERREALAMRWLLTAARARKAKPMAERLASELWDAAQMQGAAIRKREETHKMAESNKAFAHYRR